MRCLRSRCWQRICSRRIRTVSLLLFSVRLWNRSRSGNCYPESYWIWIITNRFTVLFTQYVAEMNRSMVTVTGVSSGVDWFNNVNESKNQSSGVIIAQNGKQLLILTDYSPVKQADDIIVTFNEGTQADASLKEKDETTGLAVIAVELDTLNKDFLKNDITIATFGSSNIKDIAGLPVVALGRPMGTNGSLGYGIITSSTSESAASDTTYRILQTNIVGSQNAGGVLFNLQGQVIGIITNGKSATDMKNMVCAYGITELKRHIEKMSNGEKFAYLGLKGVDVTEEANSELGVPTELILQRWKWTLLQCWRESTGRCHHRIR